LRKIVNLYADTELGRALRLEQVRTIEDYRRLVPVSTYEAYRPFTERVIATNAPGILTKDRLEYMAQTSGTTQGTKYVAYPKELIAAFKRFELAFALRYMRKARNFTLLDSEILITAGSPVCHVHPNGLTVGYASGIMTRLAPRIAKDVVRPTREVLEIADWQAKVDATVRQALPLDIRLMTGIPLWAVPVLERLLEYARSQGRDAPHAKALWPNLAVYYWSGTAIGVHEARLRELLGPGVHFQEVYSATESPIAYQSELEPSGLLVDIENTFLEFQPVGSPLDGPRIGVDEVEVGVRYRILLTTYGGLFAYALGDAVEFISKTPLLLKVCGREREELNLGGEKVGASELRLAMDRAAASSGYPVRNFFVTPAAEKVGYQCYVEFERTPDDLVAFTAALDAALRAQNSNYAGLRSGDPARLEAPVVTLIPSGAVERYVQGTRAFGQSKFVHVYPDRRAAEEVFAAIAS
jgi:hypothetical protein